MELLTQSARTYLVVIARRNASEILLLPNGSGWSLPRVDVDPERRLAKQLTAECARAWNLAACCLFELGVGEESSLSTPRCIVMEPIRHNEKAPPGTYWTAWPVATSCCDREDATAVRQALERLDGYSKGQAAGQFACCGWLRELFRWTQEQIAPRGLRLTGDFRQLNASPTFSLIRLGTDTGALWFKATGEPNAHELPVTLALARMFPHYLPEILGAHTGWNGWLAAEAAGTPLDETAEFAAWERAAEELARLQIASIGKTDELLRVPIRDLRVAKLSERISPFLARMAEFMAAQKKPSPAPLDRSELATLAEALKESCALVEGFHFPDTLGHTDCNPGNILVSQERAVFVDWSEACVTTPLVTLQYLREYLVRSGIEEPAGGRKLANAYLQPWEELYSPVELRRALALMPLVAVYAYAVAADSWRTLDPASAPNLAAYYRSLTRRMFREAIATAQRSELCLD